MKRLTLIALLATLMLWPANMNAQSWLDGIVDRTVDRAKYKVENKVDDAIDNAMDDAADKVTKKAKKDKKNKKQDADEEDSEVQDWPKTAPAPKPQKVATGESAKSDFVPGTAVMFEDNLQGEKMGEFPSKWDLISNNAEVARMNGKMAIKFENGSDTEITPLLKNGNKKYLPEVYTLEFDYFVTGQEGHDSRYHVLLKSENGDYETWIAFNFDNANWYIYRPNSDERIEGNCTLEGIHELNDWNHFALSFNKRALKVYVNNRRIINIPNARAMDWFSVKTEFWEDHIDYITNVRLAKGGVELYDRNAQDMSAIEKAIAETGQFVTNNILFETGKATLKPESMAEIQKVADFMKKNPSVRFEVQGHTDNQGSDKINDPLSEERAKAVVKALEDMGCDGFNLRAVGKGSHEPVADNKTEAGRAKNRRVVFVKK